jgi:hypothetical protein
MIDHELPKRTQKARRKPQSAAASSLMGRPRPSEACLMRRTGSRWPSRSRQLGNPRSIVSAIFGSGVWWYSTYLYPRVPIAFGGGRSEAIVIWMGAEDLPIEIREELKGADCTTTELTVRCTASTSSTGATRTSSSPPTAMALGRQCSSPGLDQGHLVVAAQRQGTPHDAPGTARNGVSSTAATFRLFERCMGGVSFGPMVMVNH